MLAAINEDPDMQIFKRTTLHLLLRYLNFEFMKRGRNSALIKREDIVANEIRSAIYYLDETWINAGDCNDKIRQISTVKSHRDACLCGLSTGAPNPTGKGKQLIALHIGSEDDFVDGGLLVFESEKGRANYHDEMNGDVFFDWLKDVIPLPKKHAVIVMDSKPLIT